MKPLQIIQAMRNLYANMILQYEQELKRKQDKHL